MVLISNLETSPSCSVEVGWWKGQQESAAVIQMRQVLSTMIESDKYSMQ